MTHIDTINWNLYRIEGWENANRQLTTLFNHELQNIPLPDNDERVLVWDTAKTLWKTMTQHLGKSAFLPFGTRDSDAEMALREAINKILGVWLDETLTRQL